MTKPCDVEKIWLFDALFRSYRDNDRPPGGVYLLEQVLPEGFSPPRHIHHNEDETFHILEGELTFTIGDQQVLAKTGDTLVGPRGIPHTFLVTSAGPARMLTFTTKGEFEAMAREAGRPARYDGLPQPHGEPAPEQMAKFEAACRANGIEVVGPPMSAAA